MRQKYAAERFKRDYLINFLMTKIARYEIKSLCLNKMDEYLKRNYDRAVKSMWAVGCPFYVGSGWKVQDVEISAYKRHEEGKEPNFQLSISGSDIEQICAGVEKRFKDLKKIS